MFAFVLQRLCLHLCCSVCVSASVFLHLFSIHNRLPSMTTLIICVIFAVAIFPTISPFGIDGNMSFISPPFDIKGKGLNCSPQAPPNLVHSTVIPEKDISASACCNFTKFSSQASCEKILWTCALLINHLCSVLDTSAYASYYLRFIRSILTFCSSLIRKFPSQSSIFNLASILLSHSLLILLQSLLFITKFNTATLIYSILI